MMSTFTIQHGSFEGPLDLLLTLIQERKLYINEISLAKVTDDYLVHIEQRTIPIAETAQFVLIASTLLLIKSRSLLPNLELTDEEESDIRDLESRLKRYQLYRAAAKKVREHWCMSPLYTSAHPPEQEIIFAPGPVSLEDIATAGRQMIAAFPSQTFRPTAHVEAAISINEMIEKLSTRITRLTKMRWSEIRDPAEKQVIVVQFLALLELIRSGVVLAEQDRSFGDILIEAEEVGTPRYD